MDVFAPRTKFARQVRKTVDLGTGFTTAYTESRNHNPLLAVNFKLFRSLSLSATYAYQKDERENYNLGTGEIQSTTVSTKRSFSMSTNYSFTSPHGITIPLLGKIKFRSTVDFSFSVKLNRQLAETTYPDADPSRSTDKSDLAFSPKISYTFSRQIRGGITMRWQDTNDNNRDRKNHVREVQLWTEIRF